MMRVLVRSQFARHFADVFLSGLSRRIAIPFLVAVVVLLPLSLSAQSQSTFVYTNDDTYPVNTVTGFSVGENGTLLPIADPFPTGGTGPESFGVYFAAHRLAVSKGGVGNFLFASNDGSMDVSIFSIDPNTGLLSLRGSPVPTGGSCCGISLAITPDNKFLMAGNVQDQNITVFSIAPDGGLTPIPGSPFPAGGVPDGMNMTPNGSFLASGLSGPVAVWSLAGNGALTAVPGSPFQGSGGDVGIDINCSGQQLFAGNDFSESTTVDVFSIAVNGALTKVESATGVGNNSNVVLLSPNNQLLFVSNQGGDTITVFTVSQNGHLTEVPGSPFPVNSGGQPVGMATNQDGTFLFVANLPGSSGSIAVFSVASDGSLSEEGSPRTLPGSNVADLAVFPAFTCVQPNFTISASPTSLQVAQGNQGTSTITTAISGGFDSAITLSASGVPPGSTVSFNPNPIAAPGSGNSTMTIMVGLSTVPGTYPITVTGNGGEIQRTVTVTLTVTRPDFTISASPTSLNVPQGSQGTSTITTAISGGFNNAIALSASGVPSGTTVSFNPNPIAAPGSGNSMMTITVGLSTVPGTYPITVTGNGGEIQHTVTVMLTVTRPDFTISASPTSLNVPQGNQGTSTITTAISGGFNSAIALSYSGAPPETTVSFNPNPIAAPGSGNSTMTIRVGLSTPVGTYPITVIGNGGGIQQNVTVTLTIPAAPPTCAPPSGQALVTPSPSDPFTVGVTAICMDTAGTITKLTVDWGDGSPVSSSSPPPDTIAGMHTYAQAGPYTITVTATNDSQQSGSTSQPVTLPWSVGGVFQGQQAQTPLSFILPQQPGQPPSKQFVSFTAMVTLLGSGPAMTCDGKNYGITCSCSPSSTTLYSDKSTPVTLTIQTTGGTTALLRPSGSRWLQASLALWMPMPAIVLLGSGFLGTITKRNAFLRYVALGFIIVLLLIVTSCGGGFTPPPQSPPSQNKTTAGNYLITIQAVDPNNPGFVQTSLIVPLTVNGTN